LGLKGAVVNHRSYHDNDETGAGVMGTYPSAEPNGMLLEVRFHFQFP
jgi:hypothetical protein